MKVTSVFGRRECSADHSPPGLGSRLYLGGADTRTPLEMMMLPFLCALAALALPAASVFRTLSRRRGARRNKAGCSLYAANPGQTAIPK